MVVYGLWEGPLVSHDNHNHNHYPSHNHNHNRPDLLVWRAGPRVKAPGDWIKKLRLPLADLPPFGTPRERRATCNAKCAILPRQVRLC